MILIYLNCTIPINSYITNLYRRKISTFSLSKDEILVKKTPTSLHEKKIVCRQWTLILIFCVDVHMGLDPLPLSTCVHLSLTPLRVDVINGWPLTCGSTLCLMLHTYIFIF